MTTPVSCSDDIEQMALSPDSQEKWKYLLKEVHSGRASLQWDSMGRPRVVYENEKKISLSHVDRSKANTVQEGKNPDDIQTRVDICLEMIDTIKKNRAPSGVVVDSSKVKVSALGSYEEGKQFHKMSEVLGKGSFSEDIVVIKDYKTGTEQALKTVMISEFSTDEIRAWVDLGGSDTFPSLYVFQLKGNKIHCHMEKIENGVTIDEIINNHMMKLHQESPDLVRPFSLYMFHGLLSAIGEMHDKNWAHRDLHGGNVMLTSDTLTLKVLDFGLARRLRRGLQFNHEGLKNDVLNAIRLFCGLYIGQDFENNFILEKEIRQGTLNKVLSETSPLNDEERKELIQLISMTYEVLQNPIHAGYGDTKGVRNVIEDKLFPAKKMDVLCKAAAILFHSSDINLSQPDTETVDGAADGGDVGDEEQMVESALEGAATAVSEDFIRSLSLRIL